MPNKFETLAQPDIQALKQQSPSIHFQYSKPELLKPPTEQFNLLSLSYSMCDHFTNMKVFWIFVLYHQMNWNCSRIDSMSKPWPLPSQYPPCDGQPVLKWIDPWSLLLKIQITTQQKYSSLRLDWSGRCFFLSLVYISEFHSFKNELLNCFLFV